MPDVVEQIPTVVEEAPSGEQKQIPTADVVEEAEKQAQEDKPVAASEQDKAVAEQEPFEVGDYVSIHSLTSPAGLQMNGKTAKILEAKSADTGRYGVRLRGKTLDNGIKQIKEANLKFFQKGEDDDESESDDDLSNVMGGMGLGGGGKNFGDVGGEDDDLAGLLGGKGGGKDAMMANLMKMMGEKGGEGGKGGGKEAMMAQMMGMMGGKGGGKEGGCPTQ